MSKPIRTKNSKLVMVLFISAILFQTTILRIIWSIEEFSRIFNALLLVLGGFFAIHFTISNNHSKKVFKNYILPGLLILIGMTFNIMFNALTNIKLLSQLGLVLPWILYLLIPFFVKKQLINVKRLWSISYHMILIFVIVGLIDYYFIYFLGHYSNIIKTQYGPFYIGNFSVLFPVIDGPHYRFYACFAEPGSLAMMLLPFILYTFLKKKYIGMIILLTGFYFTYSLGGYIGLVTISFCLYLLKTRSKNVVFSLLSSLIIMLSTYNFISSNISSKYSKKGYSAKDREDSFYDGVANLPRLLIKYPFGMPLAETTEELAKNDGYTGSNFIPLLYHQSGGILGLIGYILVLRLSVLTALKMFISKNQLKTEEIIFACSIITMIPFLLQRTTIWESSLFSFLFAPIIIYSLNQNEWRN